MTIFATTYQKILPEGRRGDMSQQLTGKWSEVADDDDNDYTAPTTSQPVHSGGDVRRAGSSATARTVSEPTRGGTKSESVSGRRGRTIFAAVVL